MVFARRVDWVAYGGLAGNLTLYNTGVDAFGAALADGSVDPHYTESIQANSVFVIPQNGAWAAPGSPAKYVAPYNWLTLYNPNFYSMIYRTSFDLSGFNPSTVLIQGQWATDNFGSDIKVNGHSTGNASPGFSGFTSFTLSGGSGFFVPGINYLFFDWGSSGGPGGVAVVFTSATADAAPIPEPASLVLLGVGLATLGLAGRRKRSHRQ